MKPIKAKICKECKKQFQPINSLQVVCNMGCAMKWARVKNAKKEKKENRKAKLEYDKNDYRKQFKLTLEAAKALCRILDDGKPCISCGTGKDVQYAAGHYKSAGAHPELALDIRNLHRQCNRYCNCGLSGNIEGTKTTHGYKAGLINRYGQWIIDYLEAYHPPKNYTCDDLIQMRKEFNAEIRYIEKHGKPSRDWRKGIE